MKRSDEILEAINRLEDRGKKKLTLSELHYILSSLRITSPYKRKEYIQWLIIIRKIIQDKKNDQVFEIVKHHELERELAPPKVEKL